MNKAVDDDTDYSDALRRAINNGDVEKIDSLLASSPIELSKIQIGGEPLVVHLADALEIRRYPTEVSQHLIRQILIPAGTRQDIEKMFISYFANPGWLEYERDRDNFYREQETRYFESTLDRELVTAFFDGRAPEAVISRALTIYLWLASPRPLLGHVEFLLEHGANPNMEVEIAGTSHNAMWGAGYSILKTGLREHQKELLDLLIKYGGKLKGLLAGGVDPIDLLNAGFDVTFDPNEISDDGRTPLTRMFTQVGMVSLGKH